MQLTPTQQKFILHWGEMGARWCINRTVAQVHALLYISPKPLNAEEITETLSVARSNISNSLRELEKWGIIRRVQFMGDRREYFESMKDVWEMFQTIMDERKRREIDPTLAMLDECIRELEETQADEPYTRERLTELRDFFAKMTAWYESLRKLPTKSMMKLVKMGGRIRQFIGAA
jgi:DNA-binding transcriptional regulator GbsR (MarR family)